MGDSRESIEGINLPSSYPLRCRGFFVFLSFMTFTVSVVLATLLNTKLGSSRRLSSLSGARKPWQTKKISADVFREEAGLVASTRSKSCRTTHKSEFESYQTQHNQTGDNATNREIN